ncbi:MAG: DUF480 domain-containing protein, partial [Acidimicrobiia bacterium]|nr:DUF480 domain-containing protein [Acidimicrobiia bacterium]
KYRQALDDQLQTSGQETALLAVLMLRGPQTPGELRQRTSRYVEFVSLPELEAVLTELGRRQLAVRLERQPGQKESRYQELLTGETSPDSNAAFELVAGSGNDEPSPVTRVEPEPAAGAQTASRNHEAELDDLTRRFEVLLERLGEEID